MFSVRVFQAFSTGAPRNKFYNCVGTAIHRSPKRAMELASQRSDRCEGSEQFPIWREIRMWRNNTLILHEVD